MTRDARAEVTAVVTALGAEREPADAVEELMLLVYPDLRRLARKYLAGERVGHTLQPTAVVHEAYCKLVNRNQVSWRGRTHFFAVGARVMRQVLVDYARSRKRAKRGGDWLRVSLHEGRQAVGTEFDVARLLTLNSALERLADLDPRQAKILELRYFAGLTVQEVATALGVSKRTVEGDWTHARVWLRRELERGEDIHER